MIARHSIERIYKSGRGSALRPRFEPSIARLADDAPVAHPESWVVREAPSFTVAEPARRRNPVATGEARGPQTVDREAAGGLDPTTYIDATPVMDRLYAALKAEARASGRATVKLRARAYALEPQQLDAIFPELSKHTPRSLVNCLIWIRRDFRTHALLKHRGEVPAINLRGAMLYARYLRAKARQLAKRAA